MATKNIIPRNNNEGKIGTNSKKWAEGHFESLSVAGQSVSGGGATALNGLTDVTISSVQNNQVLKYNGSNWVNAAAPATLNNTDDLGEGSSNLYFTNERVDDRVNALTIAGIGITKTYDDSANTLTLALDLNELSVAAVDVGSDAIVIIDSNDSNGSKKESISDLITAIAGNGLSASNGVLAVGVDDSSIEINSDALRIKASGVTDSMLAGSITDSKLNQITAGNKVAGSAIQLASTSALEDSSGLRIKNSISGSGLDISNQVLSTSPQVITVTVSGSKFLLDGVSQKVDSLVKGVKYKFDQSDSSNTSPSHPLRFSTTSDGTHGGGTEYTTGVTKVGTPGSSGAYTEIIVPHSAPATLYYYCANHSGMGASVQTEVVAGSGLSKTASTISVDATIITGQAAVSSAHDDDLILVYDDSDSTLKKMTRATFTSGLGGGGGSSTTLQNTVTSTSTLTGATSGTHVWLLDGSTITVTLPNSNITNGTIYQIKNINSTAATVSGTIDNLSSKSLSQYDNLTLVATSTGSQWYIL